ncbi:SIR2 family protein [Bacillus toyonensis]|uniref:SIR2 family protein n=1 Tax=Bacillus toyonensis TaxID=155322 RepID=UPI00211EB424|nr:SIR2 family protein [Bacillus toyonensis]
MSEELTITQDDINEIPDIRKYQDIIKAAKSGNLIVFVGAGVSRLLDLPSWQSFALERLETVYNQGLIDSPVFEELKNLDPKKILTICEIIMKENNTKPSLAKDVFKFENNEKYKDVYSKLYSINAIYITTNYDECLDQLALQVENSENLKGSIDESEKINLLENNSRREIVIERSELLESKLKNGNVIHIHGSVKKEEDMLVTLKDYLDCYGTISKQSYPELSIFLDKVFNSKYVVLFMGYGLEEYEILEYMLSKTKNPEHTMTHYMLYPTSKENYKMIDLLRKYYRNFGVELIPFDISRNGYNQLIPIISEWSKVLSEVSRDQDFISKTLFIDEILKSKASEFNVRSKSIIELIKTDESLEVYFFNNANEIRWLSILLEEGFYSPERVPNPIKVDNGYRIPYWSQTDYLKKITDQLQPENEKEINAILSIIKEISFYADKEGKHIDNYHVWKQFIDILSKIPNQYIDLEMLDMLEIWTDSMFRIDFISYEIAKKLLFKFLNSQEQVDIIKAEKIIECLIKLDCANNQVKLGKYYFSKVFSKDTVKLISEKCSMQLIVKIMKQINEFLGDSESNNEFEYGDKQYKLKVSNLKEKYTIKILEKSEIMYKIELEKMEVEDFTEQVANWLLTKFSKEKLGPNIKNKIRSIYYGLYYKETYYSMHEMGGEYTRDGFELILDLFKKLLNYKKKSQMEELLNDLINEDYLLFQKILLYIIGDNFPTYNNVFWSMLNQKKGEFIFQDPAFEDELRVILEQFVDLNKNQQEKLLSLINKGPNIYSIIENEQKYIDIWKQKRLSALKKMPLFNELYTKLKEKTKLSPELRPMIGKVKTKSGSVPSPLTEDQLLKMTNNEIAEYMREFKTIDLWEGPTIYSLGQKMKEFTKKYPNRIVEDLELFIDTGYYYINQILSGLIDAWMEKESFDWGKLLQFISLYIDRPEFWKDKFKTNDKHWDINYKSVLKMISALFRIGSKDIEWAFEHKHFNEAKEILLLILRKIRNLEQEDHSNDSVSYVLNSVKGTALQAALTMSVLDKNRDTEKKWDDDFRTIYTEYLKHNTVDAYILLGWELPLFFYLEREWTIDKINSVTFEDEIWESLMSGYINCRNIYKNIYILMKDHYKHAIDYSFKEKDVKKGLAQHLAIGYLNDFEKEINEELYKIVLKTWNYEIIEEFIRSFCRQEKTTLKEHARQRIIEFWETFYLKYNEYDIKELSEGDKKLLSESLNFIYILNDIEETNYHRLKFAIPFTEVNYNSYVIIEGLHQKIKESDLKNKRVIIGELMNDLVESCIPTYPEEIIINLVKYLYDANDERTTEIAKNICNIYTKNNVHFLREIYLMYKDN